MILTIPFHYFPSTLNRSLKYQNDTMIPDTFFPRKNLNYLVFCLLIRIFAPNNPNYE